MDVFVDVPGARLNCEVEGEGEPVLLIGGLGAGIRFWDSAMPYLKGYRVVRWDNRGVGLTEYDGGITLERMAEDAVAVMDGLGIEKAHVLGWSMGSEIGQVLGSTHPDRLRSLTLVATYLERPARTEYVLGTLMGMMIEGKASVDSFSAVVNAFSFSEPVFRKFRDSGRRIPFAWRDDDIKGLCDQMASVDARDMSDIAPKIAVPTLVVHGTDDIMVGFEEGKRASEAIPGSLFLPIPGAGHNILFSAYAEQFRGFVDSHN